jgi:diphosphoinositol-polyphosphate diphosphatase
VFRSKSSQSEQSSDSPRGACKGHVFALEVTEELEQWPEQDTHGRRWVSPADSYGLCRYDWMREALTALLDRSSTWTSPVVAAVAVAESPAVPDQLNEHAGMCMNMILAADRAVALC